MSYCVIGEIMVEGHSIPAMSTTDFLSGLHPQNQYFRYYSSSPTTNNTAVGTQMNDIYGGEMSSSTYCQDPRVQGHQHNSTTLDVDVDYEVQDDQEDNNYELLTGLTNIHVEKEKEEERRPWEAAAVSSWEWPPRFGGTLESIIDQTACSVPLIINVPDLGVHDDHGNEVEDQEDHEYCHMAPQVIAEMKKTVVQSKQYSTCNMEWMTVADKGEHNPCYSAGHNSTPPPPSYRSQREALKITEKRQMQRGKSSTTISSSNKRSKATILHNKSERKRRGKINDRMETLQKLVPNINKQSDKASMLDQVIEYVKKLQTQNDQMMNMRLGMFDNNNMPVAVHPMTMMHPYYMTMQAMQQQQHHQQQMSMMAQMGRGMSMNPASLVMMPTGSVVLPNMRRE